jgi:hypothetical protein
MLVVLIAASNQFAMHGSLFETNRARFDRPRTVEPFAAPSVHDGVLDDRLAVAVRPNVRDRQFVFPAVDDLRRAVPP